ncbi:TPA: NAD-dependent aldehyde dehydrogenase [Serratia marcescens]|uniref:NAD-dependent aldehyde dehydrogenase n=1 Tax=Serratia nevei TaxID=2703794 RepID=A0AAW6X8G4_9GAMM|nr:MULTISPECIES: NAD-dependent aldehyde dehydrogenase [Serratia]EGT3595802.1 NAD-dependent aldehyde dehydrogenase [Serratia marcescens]MBH3173079.1 NAD-dependent aldehyde dehydrogenase [Serratia marcescens]MDK4767627.1 NAD-dependent aldehyde dehydrogenase [Serratia nevei]MDK4774576.1 NAD-dependent aldehyde dehydrogenase [Serratia nevei]MDK4798194.1 NAD-dependent aldehyde dehydrogenase [Serratia nevei]
MSTTALPKSITDKLQALRDARAAHDKNYQALNDVVTGIARCHQQKKETEVESHEAESQWRTLFRKLRGEMTPELQAQHHSRISKRELAKEFDGLIEEMELDKIGFHLRCGESAPKVVTAHKDVLTTFAAHAMHQAVDAMSTALISPDVIKACALAVRAYGVYEGNPMKMIEQQILGTLQGRIYVAIAQQNINHPVLNEIGLTIPQETGVLPELKRSPAKRMQVALELKEKRQRMQQKGTKS